MENAYQTGNTIRLTCIFRDFDGVLRNPNLVKVKIYDQTYKVIQEESLGLANNTADGEYFYDYTIPLDARGKMYYEWYGEISGNPSLKRDSFKVTFI
jgi:hypothetical protein